MHFIPELLKRKRREVHMNHGKALSTLTLVALVAALAGCTLIGLGVGSMVKTDGKTLSGWEVMELKTGEKMLLSLNDGSELEVTYRGWEEKTVPQYRAQYEEWRSSADFAFMPGISDSVTVTPDSGEVVLGEFYGFDSGFVLVRATNRPARHQLADIKLLSGTNGESISGATLVTETTIGAVPLRTVYRFVSPSGVNHRLYPRDIRQITTNPRGNGTTGLMIGMAIDLVIVVAAIVSTSDERRKPNFNNDNTQSCPYVYSFDGAEYVLDAEPLGGAWFQSVQRTDYVRLDHAQPVEGEYRIRVQTELDETDHIDALELIAVDRPVGSEVVPGYDGRMFVLSNAAPPILATTLDRDIDVLDRVTHRDDQFWISNPFNRDLNSVEALRDGLIVAFERPQDADSATMAFTVRSTPWTSDLIASFLELHGDSLDAWYAEMNASKEATMTFAKAFQREALMSMEVWSGSDWQRVGTLAGAEPAVSGNYGVRVALPNVATDTLRIRLTSSPGLWMIDRIAVDYGPWRADKVTPIKLTSATDESGRSVIDEIAAIDGRYHHMPEIGQRIDLRFDAPELAPRLERTVVLAATGFYTVHVEGDGEPQSDLADRILTEPGVFADWSLRKLYRERDEMLAGWRADKGGRP